MGLAIFKFNRKRIIISNVLFLVSTVAQFATTAWILGQTLYYIENKDSELWKGVLWALLLSLCLFITVICYYGSFVASTFTGICTKGALQMMVYKKILRVYRAGESMIGQVVDFSTDDVIKIAQYQELGNTYIATPIIHIILLYYTIEIFGVWALIGNSIFVFYYGYLILTNKLCELYRGRGLAQTDKRVTAVNQIFSNIKMLKMYAWEEPFAQSIQETRKIEKKNMLKVALINSVRYSSTPVLAIIGPMAMFIAHVLDGHPLNMTQAFTVISAFSSAGVAILLFPATLQTLAMASIGWNRIKDFLNKEDSQITVTEVVNQNIAINITSACLFEKRYESPKNEKLQAKISNGICENGTRVNYGYITDAATDELPFFDFVIPKGKLIGICGNVGSGKSTLFSIIIGKEKLVAGKVSISGSIAYVPQESWIFNATVRDNILFGQPYEEQWYNKVVEACSLLRDFKIMPNGDLTEIFDRGANLSGGQCKRVSIARALYTNRDIYLLDDPLSAVDNHVAQHIFKRCIKEELKGKTVLLITHSIKYLEQCDEIAYMKNGRVHEQGTHSSLMNKEGEFYRAVKLLEEKENEILNEKKNGNKNNNPSDIDGNKIEDSNTDAEEQAAAKLLTTDDENDASFRFNWPGFVAYMNACGGPRPVSFAGFMILFFNGLLIFSTVWLKSWLDYESTLMLNLHNETVSEFHNESSAKVFPETEINRTVDFWTRIYMLIFGLSGLFIILVLFAKGFLIPNILLNGASVLHNTMLRKLCRSSMQFFHLTPLGRVLNRFSLDMADLDFTVPIMSEMTIQNLLYIFFLIILTGVIFPWSFIPLTLIFGLAVFTNQKIVAVVQATKYANNVSVSSVIGHMSTTLQGISTIRTFQKGPMYLSKFEGILDFHLSRFTYFLFTCRWFGCRVDFLAWALFTVLALLLVLLRQSIAPSVAGLALSSMFQANSMLPICTRLLSEIQAYLVSAQRIINYCQDLKEESNLNLEGDKTIKDEWPMNGEISFEAVEFRYHEDLPPALKDLNVAITTCEKIGVIGRTGAGKSSIIACILGLADLYSGSITIDGLNLSKVGRCLLRSRIATIPQDPTLFEGTVRYNLDPFKKYSDVEIWDALEKSHLKKKITETSEKLDSSVGTDGSLFSVGEKQLLCLARAMLRKNKILLLDEATASVDYETDHLIQKTIREAFANCTVITIAHRLNTIWDSDRIVVMDSGKVKEIGSPQYLMSLQNSQFRSMLSTMEGAN